MRPVLTKLVLCLAVLLASLGDASGRAVLRPEAGDSWSVDGLSLAQGNDGTLGGFWDGLPSDDRIDVGMEVGPNLYAYCIQNPWTHWDPDGLESTKAGVTVTRDGHHVSPVKTWDKNGLSADVQKELNKMRIKPEGGAKVTHRNSLAHQTYNAEADDVTQAFVDQAKKKGIDASKLKGDDARAFAQGLRKDLDSNPYIKQFNRMIKEGKGTVQELNAMRDVAMTRGIVKDASIVASDASKLRMLSKSGGLATKVLFGLAVFSTSYVQAKDNGDSEGGAMVVGAVETLNLVPGIRITTSDDLLIPILRSDGPLRQRIPPE